MVLKQNSWKIVVYSEVINQILDLARASHPHEYMAYFGGKIKQNTITIDSVYYQHFVSNRSHTTSTISFGASTQGYLGTVHSHPSGNNFPSHTDLGTFSDYPVNIIIGYPYRREHIAVYDGDGKRIVIREVKEVNKFKPPVAILQLIGVCIIIMILIFWALVLIFRV